MGLQGTIEQDYKDAFKSGQRAEIELLRMVKSALKNEEIALRKTVLDDPEVLKVLNREAKRRREAIELYQKGQRPELAAREQGELVIIQRYLPAALSDAELTALIKTVISETQASSPADIGKVMGAVMQRCPGQTDGHRVKTIVQSLLPG